MKKILAAALLLACFALPVLAGDVPTPPAPPPPPNTRQSVTVNAIQILLSLLSR